MITVQDFLETIDHRITGGSEYLWQCFGAHARYLDCDSNRSSASMVFDSEDQTVYQVTVCDYDAEQAYRWTDPNWTSKFMMEVVDRGGKDQAWDDVTYTDLELAEDLLTKARAIVRGESYDTRISIPINLPDDEMLVLMTMAHEQDMTFNDFVEDLLRKMLTDLEARADVEELDQIQQEVKSQLKKNKNKRVPRKSLALELEGVIADVEHGNGFDPVCLNTLKRVVKQLTKD